MGNFRDVLRDIILYNVTLALTLVGSNVIHPPLFVPLFDVHLINLSFLFSYFKPTILPSEVRKNVYFKPNKLSTRDDNVLDRFAMK